METSQAGACMTRAGVRGTRCQCLRSDGQKVRRGCSLCVISAVQAACRVAASPPPTCRGSHACTHLTCSAARLIKKRRLRRIARTSCTSCAYSIETTAAAFCALSQLSWLLVTLPTVPRRRAVVPMPAHTSPAPLFNSSRSICSAVSLARLACTTTVHISIANTQTSCWGMAQLNHWRGPVQKLVFWFAV